MTWLYTGLELAFDPGCELWVLEFVSSRRCGDRGDNGNKGDITLITIIASAPALMYRDKVSNELKRTIR